MRYRHDGFRALEQARRVAEGNGPVAFEDSDPASTCEWTGWKTKPMLAFRSCVASSSQSEPTSRGP